MSGSHTYVKQRNNWYVLFVMENESLVLWWNFVVKLDEWKLYNLFQCVDMIKAQTKIITWRRLIQIFKNMHASESVCVCAVYRVRNQNFCYRTRTPIPSDIWDLCAKKCSKRSSDTWCAHIYTLHSIYTHCTNYLIQLGYIELALSYCSRGMCDSSEFSLNLYT